MREIFILQFDIGDKSEPNEVSCTSIKLEGSQIEFKSIHPVTAVDVYEAITDHKLWKGEEECLNS